MANTIATNLLSYLGVIHTSGHRTGSLVPRAGTPMAQQELYRDFMEAGKVADPDVWTKYNTAMRRPTTFDAMLQLWEEMAMWDLVAAALVEIVDEATQVDQNSPATVWYECNDHDFADKLNQMLVGIGIEDIAPSQVWHVAALGNHFEKIEYAPNEGVMGLSFVHPMEIRRYWLERNRKCIGFRWQQNKPDKSAVFVHPDNQTPIERVAISDGKNTEDLWYPWDFLHFRRMFKMRITEHGEPIFAEADGIYKKLKMAIDQMVVHRAQVQPDRYAINIDVKDQVPSEQVKTVQRWKQALRTKLAFSDARQGMSGGPSNTLSAPMSFDSFYNAWSLDTILWVARPTGFQHVVEKLQGTQNIPDVYDIELLTDLFYSIIGMPRSWFSSRGGPGGGGEGEAPASGKALLAQDMRFLRKIKSIRRPLINCYTWLGYFHAILMGKDIRQLDIKANMPPIGSLEEQMKMEMLRTQGEVLDVLADVMDKYSLPKEAWIEIVFKKYLHLPDDIVNIFITALPAQAEPVPVESMKPRQPAPATYKLLREVEETIQKNRASGLCAVLREQAKMIPQSNAFVEMRAVAAKEGISAPQIKPWDIIVSSYGRHPFDLPRTPGQPAGSGKTMVNFKHTLNEGVPHRFNRSEPPLEEAAKPANGNGAKEPAYRRYMKL